MGFAASRIGAILCDKQMRDDWRERFRSWLHSDTFAHPDSPAGGSGTGFSRHPGFTSYSWSRLPHPDSPAGRYLDWQSELRRKQIVVNLGDLKRLGLAAERALPKLPSDVRQKVSAMLTPKAIATLGVIATVGVGAHWIGIGEVVDVVLIGYGVWTVGPEAKDVGRDLGQFFTIAIHAQTDRDLDRAADHFARAIAVIGIDGLAAILMHKAFKAVREFTAGAGAAGPRSQGSMQTLSTYISDEEEAHTLANKVHESPRFKEVVDDLSRGHDYTGDNKWVGAKFGLQRVTEECAAGRKLALEDIRRVSAGPDRQAVDAIDLETGDAVQFKSYRNWSDVQRNILKQAASDNRRYSQPHLAADGSTVDPWHSAIDGKPLSGRFEYQIDGDRLLRGKAEYTEPELENFKAELEKRLNEEHGGQPLLDENGNPILDANGNPKQTSYSVKIFYGEKP